LNGDEVREDPQQRAGTIIPESLYGDADEDPSARNLGDVCAGDHLFFISQSFQV
jgi:hypothetical protein